MTSNSANSSPPFSLPTTAVAETPWLEGTLHQTDRLHQGWTPRPAGKGGFPAPPRTLGKGGVPRPATPRKNDQNGGEVAGQNKSPNLNFL